MGPFDDIDQLIKILILVLLFGGWIVRAIVQSLIKPARRPPGRPAHQGGPPAKGLREFLEEIRREEAGGAGPPAAPARAERERDPVWEEVQVEEPPRDPRPQLTPLDERLRQRRLEAERRRAEQARQREERRRQREREFAARDEETELVTLADRQGEPTLGDRPVEHALDPISHRQVATRLRSKVGTGHARARTLAGPLQGRTARDLLLAQVILGKPRAMKRHVRDM